LGAHHGASELVDRHRLTADQTALSWPSWASNFVLQQNFDLASTNWVDVTNQPTLNVTNLSYQVGSPPSSSNTFYRLRQR
jgi:hypothetical protein